MPSPRIGDAVMATSWVPAISALFLIFVRWLTVTAGLRLTLLMIPALSYSLFHQGMRARPFWLLLAVALGLGVMTAIERSRDRRATPLSLADR